MRLVESRDIDKSLWDKLVADDPTAEVYNASHFLDHLAEGWCAVIYDDYKGGMAIPYSKRLGVEGIYTPNFIRAIDWVGEMPEEMHQIEEQLKKRFKRCDLNMTRSLYSQTDPGKHFQVLPVEKEVKLNSNGKRALKRFDRSDYKIESCNLSDVLPIITKELQDKVSSLRVIDLERFEAMLLSYKLSEMKVLGVKNTDGTVLGGAVFIPWKEHLLYVKGGCSAVAKDEGAMYALLEEGINYAKKHQLQLDFGGSNVEGVRRFNKSFGATDQGYYNWNWNNAPGWFNLLLKLRSYK